MKITIKKQHRITKAVYFAYRHTIRSGRPWHQFFPCFLDGLTVHGAWLELVMWLLIVGFALIGLAR
jgi:hypothetical protein